MPLKKTCFVVMGFGQKTDYATGRVLDLDKSYKYIIKPAAEEAGLECKRADEIIHSGTIDLPMFEQLLTADVVVADVSTSNPNAFYELGVRHALRPYTTITIAEDKMVFPFDVNHIAIQRYHHLGEDIGFGEVVRMKSALKNALESIVNQPKSDSPIYTLFTDLQPPARKVLAQAVANAAAALPLQNDTSTQQSISSLLKQASSAVEASDFSTAKSLLTAVRVLAPQDSFVVQRLALATYKSKSPSSLAALEEARTLLAGLKPEISTDTETLGLWGAVHKLLWKETRLPENLEQAIFAYEKSFALKNDYWNGINLAFLYDVRANVSTGAEATADRVLADRARKRVLALCDTLLAKEDVNHPLPDKYWLLATMAEASIGLGKQADADTYLQKASQVTPAPAGWMLASTREQLAQLLANRPGVP